MILLVNSGGKAAFPEWQAHFAECAPQLDVRWWRDPEVPQDQVAYALVWTPEPGRLAALPALRLILSSAAGVDHVTRDPAWPRHIALVRMGAPEVGQRMGEYVCLGALALLRDLPRAILAQAAAKWERFDAPRTAVETRVGIMGMGNLGVASAIMLRGLGFQVAGWSRGRKAVDGVQSFAGDEELGGFLARTDILVCLLPHTPDTAGILSADLFAQLPRGAGVLNAARGGHLVVPDLLAALDSGQLSGAMLDVFDPEPLPAGSPLWRHPKVIVTPHVASEASRRARAEYVADCIARFERGEALPNLYDPVRGY